MFRILFILATLFATSYATPSFSQEFRQYSNGLIYNETTMANLRFIVDSMNLKYKKCDPWKKYLSPAQATCNAISLDSANVKKAMTDIKSGISFDDFCTKYPKAEIEKQLLVTRYKYTDYDNNRRAEFSTLEMGKAYERSIQLKDSTMYDKP